MWNILSGIAGGVICGTVALQARRNYLDALSQRTEASGGGVLWNVHVNGVTVTTISDADYARVRKDVFSDVRTYFCQLRNLAWCAARMLDYIFIAIPLAAFWLGLAMLITAPEETAAALRQVRNASAQELAASVRFVFGSVVPVLTIIALGFNVAFVRARFGYKNIFKEKCAEYLKRTLGVATPGEVELVTIENGVIRYNDESVYTWGKWR